MSERTIHVAAGIVVDAEGRYLLVRKRGTSAFMQPGGKPEPGETSAQALVRELAEEVGIVVDPAALTPRGTWRGAAANEPGHVLVADVFDVAGAYVPVASAEIVELAWVEPDRPDGVQLAPLTLDLFRVAAERATDGRAAVRPGGPVEV